MFSFLGVTVGWAAIVMYGYVVIAIIRAEYSVADSGPLGALTKAFLWPLTIWSTIQKLYDTDPLN